MEFDLSDRRHVALFVAAIVVVTAVASLGFASLSNNPLVPDASFDAHDADDAYQLNRTGTVEMLVVEHTGGEAVALSDVELLLGSQADGAYFNASGDWQYDTGELEYSVLLNGAPPNGSAEFTEGDRLVVAKTDGTSVSSGNFGVRVRIFHQPSQSTIVDQQVEIR